MLVRGDHEAANTVVLTWRSWQTLFGADPSVVGRTVRLDGASYMVVGVVEEAFHVPQGVLSAGVDFIAPIDWTDELYVDPGYWVLEVAGRLAPRTSFSSVDAQLG